MATAEATDLLRPGLLSGLSVLVAGAPWVPAGSAIGLPAERSRGESDACAATVAAACGALGAWVSRCEPTATDEAEVDAAVIRAVGVAGKLDLLAVDGAGLFARGLAGGPHAALRACMDAAWNVTRATVNHAFVPATERGEGRTAELVEGATAERVEGTTAEGTARRIVYVAPAPDAGAHAGAAAAGLENLARTLSIEWARYGIATVTIAPGSATAAGEVAALVAYLASPAGAYFSGCLLDLRGP